MSCRIRAVEHRKFAAGLVGVHPGLQDRILLNYTRIENAHEVRKNIFVFIVWLLYVQLLRGKKRYGLVWADMINPPEMPVNDEARNEAHIANTGARLY